MELCPCGSGMQYEQCCELFISGTKKAESAEQLMRSRYSAYVQKEVDYIVETVVPNQQKDIDKKGIQDWAEKTTWTKLEILNCAPDSKNSDIHTVEFVAHYHEAGVYGKHHEIGVFKRVNSQWYYEDSKFPKPEQVVRSQPKTPRNAPCPCGSGKKYKKCCVLKD